MPDISDQRIDILYLTQNKMNLFVLLGHGSESFAAFLNELIFGSCIVEATKVVPNNKVSEFQH